MDTVISIVNAKEMIVCSIGYLSKRKVLHIDMHMLTFHSGLFSLFLAHGFFSR